MDKNKKEQTFKDLFSNLQKENKEESFNNLFNETKNVNASENKLFSDILNETPSLVDESKSSPQNENDIDSIIDKSIEKLPKQNGIDYNPFFEDDNEVIKAPELEEDTISKNEEILKEDKLEDNPFLEQNNKEKEELPQIELDNIFNNKETPKEEKTEENPFFNDNSNEIVEPPEEPKKEEKIEEPIKEEKDPLDENPFFIDNEDNLEKMEKQLVDDKINLVENKKHDISTNENSTIDTSNVKHFNVKIVKKKDPPIKFILGVLSYALFIWLLLIGIALLVYVADIKIRAAKGDTSSPTFNAYVVLTGSMLPEIQVYDVVVTKKTPVKDLKEGDVITFASSDTRFLNTIITHRILKKYYDSEKKQYTFQTKGDNNNVADSALVQEGNIFGKVIFKIPKLGYLQEFLASRGGWIIAILLPCLAVISYDIVKLMKSLKRKKYKNIKVQK